MTTRWVSSSNETAAAAQSVAMVVFADLDIVGDRLRIHDGVGTINWGGFDWLGVGSFGSVESIDESLEVIARPVHLKLSGVDPQLITDAMTTQYHERAVVLYIGLFNVTTLALIATPEEVWSGYMDVMTIDIDHNQAAIDLICEHRLRKLPNTSRYTDEDQRTLFAGDTLFDKLHLIPGHMAKWGSTNATYSSGGRSGDGPPEHHQRP
jgi:hypothetical protein